MASKSKISRLEQKAYLEEKLDKRLSFLSEKGIEPGKISKDTGVKKIRAQMRETEGRLKVISDMERKVEEMASIKAEKMAAPKKEKEKKVSDEVSAVSKRQKKKKKKSETKAKE
jgi:hypothetical protein